VVGIHRLSGGNEYLWMARNRLMEEEVRCRRCQGHQQYRMLPCSHPICAYCTNSVITPNREGKTKVVLCPVCSLVKC
jgi:hypothetical protein